MTQLEVLSKGKAGYQVRDGQGGAWSVKLNGTVSCSCGKPQHLCPHIAAARRWERGDTQDGHRQPQAASREPQQSGGQRNGSPAVLDKPATSARANGAERVTAARPLAVNEAGELDWQTLRGELIRKWIEPSWVCVDKDKQLYAAYVPIEDVVERLDALVGAERWSLDVAPLAVGGDTVAVIARLTIGGVTKAATGEDEPTPKRNGQGVIAASYSKAEASAVKRAAMAWGIGRYTRGQVRKQRSR